MIYRLYYGDLYYLVLVLPALLLAVIASIRVNSTFKKYSRMQNQWGMSGYDAARRVLDSHGLYDVQICPTSGSLTDHYDPSRRTVFLSEDVYSARTPAAVGVAAHEAGHALQHAENYGPLKLRNAIVKATNIGSMLGIPLILLGILLSGLGSRYIWIAYAGVALYSLCALFQLLTLPTEFDASRRAVTIIESWGLLTQTELQGARKVLRAAAMTYVAALAVSLTQLLRLLLLVMRADGRGRK